MTEMKFSTETKCEPLKIRKSELCAYAQYNIDVVCRNISDYFASDYFAFRCNKETLFSCLTEGIRVIVDDIMHNNRREYSTPLKHIGYMSAVLDNGYMVFNLHTITCDFKSVSVSGNASGTGNTVNTSGFDTTNVFGAVVCIGNKTMLCETDDELSEATEIISEAGELHEISSDSPGYLTALKKLGLEKAEVSHIYEGMCKGNAVTVCFGYDWNITE